MADGGDLMGERYTVEISGQTLVLIEAIRARVQSPTELSAATGIRPSAVTAMVKVLGDLGLIGITPGPKRGVFATKAIHWLGKK